MYWDRLLIEVLNKNNPDYGFYVTPFTQKRPTVIREPRKRLPAQKKVAKKYLVGANYPNVFLTEREAQAIFYYLQYKSSKDVAVHLCLSRRTVEFYLKNVKIKLGCLRKKDLLALVKGCDFLERVTF